MTTTNKEYPNNWISTSKWIGLAMPLLLIFSLSLPWICRLAGIPTDDIGIENSFIQRLFRTPNFYLPILLTVQAVIAIAIWPGKTRFPRNLIATGIFFGLGLAVMWNFDGGLGNLLFIAGWGLLYFGIIDCGLAR
jgi:hypothetical protein